MSHLRLAATTLLVVLCAVPVFANHDLIISEYIEGSSNNKAIEIYNPTSGPIDLTALNYRLLIYFNGATSATGNIALTGTIAAGTTRVIAHSSANATILAAAQQTTSSLSFNGDDAVVLTKSASFTVVDSIGQVGTDPGAEWGTGLTSTADNTIRRKATVCEGDTTTGNAFDPATEFDGFATDEAGGLGSHTIVCQPTISIGDAVVTEGNAGTVTATFTVQLSSTYTSDVTFTATTADGTATTADNDYVAKAAGGTITAGNTTTTFTVDVNGDTNVENNETFLVNLSNIVNAIAGDIQGQATINNDDSPTLSVSDVSQTETDAGTTFTFTVSLTQAAGAGGVTFDYATAAGTATAGGDYTEISTTSGSIGAGNTSTTIDVTVIGDNTYEPDETFFLNVTNVAGATVGDGQGQGTILNDDLGISVNNVSKNEGNSGTTTYNFVVTTTAAPGAETVTFDISTVDGTALAGSDYVPLTVIGQTISGASTTFNFDVVVNGDTTFEPTETFSVELTNISGATLITNGTGTITNDDAAPAFTINDVKVVEGNAGTSTMTFTVSLLNASTEPSSVNYITSDGSATAGVDYEGTSGTLNFAAGDTLETFTVTINGDTAIEGVEQLIVTLSGATGATISDATGIGAIDIDDAFSIAAVNTAYAETFDTLSSDDSSGARAATTPAAWTYSETGSGTNATYRPSDGSSNTGNAGDTYSLGTTGSPDRAFGGIASSSLSPTVGAFYINNTGEAITTLSINYTGEEWRLGDTTAPIDKLDFAYSTNATSLSTGTWTNVDPLDFNSPNQTGTGAKDGNAAANRTAVGYTISGLSIAPGSTFWIRWTNSDDSGTDDALGIDGFSILANLEGGVATINDVTVTEGDAGTVNATFTVLLSEPAGPGGVTFDIATANNTATAGVDYTADSATGVNIPEGATSYDFVVVINGDTDVEPTETFFVNVTNLGGATLNDGQAIGTIASDDFTFTAIHDIQGPGLQSPLVGSTVTIDGYVTAIKTGSSGGFFVQAPEADYDADPNTSEGIFVFTGATVPAGAVIGYRVAVTGTVTEFPASTAPNTMTELTGATVDVQSTEIAPLPAPIVLTAADGAPSSNLSQYERYEGMRVSATLTVVAPTAGSIDEDDANATSNGVFYGVIQGVARPFREPGIEQSYTIPPEATCPACIDRFDENPEKLRVDSDNQPGATQLNVAAGQTVSNLVGPLDYGFLEYTLLPEAASVPVVTGDSTADPVPAPLPTELTISGFNLLHFFDTTDDPGVSDVVLTPVAYDKRLAKASLAIRNILQTPDVIGVVEADNINTLQALAARINTDTAGVTNYVAYLEEGNDVGGIDVGFLVDANRVTVQAVTQIGKDTTWINPHTGLQDSSNLNDRPSLVLEASIPRADATLYEFTVIVNHLRSLIGIQDNTAGGRRVRAKRAAQAEFLASYVQSRQVADPTEKIILVGDFNAFEFNDGFVDVMGTIKGTPAPATEVVEPTDDLVNPDLTNLIETLPQETRYTYTFDGNAQAIDHALVNAAMLPSLSRFAVAHLDADYPNIFYADGTRPERLSDHDATLAYFSLSPLSQMAIGDGSVTEGASGTTQMTFTVTLSSPVPTPVTVNYTTSDGTATAGSDYIAESGTVTFVANDQSETITIDVNGDLLLEGNETFTVTLSNPSVTTMITDGTATGTILNDDVAASMNIADTSVTEGNAGTTSMTFTVTLATPVPETVTVNYTTSNGTAIAGTDYVAESGTITFAPNDQSEQITIDVTGDIDFEGDETLTVTLSNASPTTTIVDGTATGTILNDDTPSGMFISDTSATETNGVTTMTFTVSLANPVGSTVTVDYATANGTATAGSDYVAQTGTLTFVAGDQSEPIVITINGDTAFEADEQFTVTLSNATATTSISDATATGTILNDDAAVADLTLTMTSSPANPGAGQNVTYTLVVTNNGPQQATGVVVTDDLPNGMVFVSAGTTQGTCTGTDPVQCNVGTLGVGQSATITIVAHLPAGASGSFVNTANADAAEDDSTAAAASVTITLAAMHGDIPTLSEWMLILLAMMLAAVAAAKLRL